MTRKSIGERLVRVATMTMWPGWEIPFHTDHGELAPPRLIMDCFGMTRRAIEEFSKDLDRWESEGGPVLR